MGAPVPHRGAVISAGVLLLWRSLGGDAVRARAHCRCAPGYRLRAHRITAKLERRSQRLDHLFRAHKRCGWGEPARRNRDEVSEEGGLTPSTPRRHAKEINRALMLQFQKQ